MKKVSLVLGTCGIVVVSSAAHAQSAVTLYGIIDAGIAYTNNVSKGGTSGSLVQATSGEINGSRFGLRGAEDLGGGLKAIFVLENGFSVQSGKLAQNNREFGRQAFVGISSNLYGTITLGRQYDSLVDFVAPLSGTAGTFGDTGFAHPFDNDNLNHSVRMNNSVKYTSNNYAGFKAGALYAFSNNTDFAMNRAYSVGASYNYGPLNVAAGYLQINGSNSTANTAGAVDLGESAANGTGGFQLGADVQRTVGAGLNYAFGPAVVGFVYTHSQFQGSQSFGSNNGTVRFDNYEVNGKYALTPALSLGASYVFTNGHVSDSTTFGEDPKWNQVNLQTVYSLSKRTDVYLEGMYQHASGHNFVAFINTAGGASSTANQVMATVGMRTRF
ncbi:Outer membrane protein (porin) [Caballeronia glathei]|uniref:Porin n=1 Tax=Caballeronia glathei TaxID=60547 RepID=A0A069PXE0_9BURK|nr:porin [Caballeronia glathei]KDR42066.1 porin [Caballeronia glathei]CDY77676.1 Outer membrane protein (porin) [Caballeronia glathei]